MNHHTFWSLIKKYFSYLADDFGFVDKEYYDAQYENFSVGYVAHDILISFSYDRGDVYIDITNLKDPQRRGHDPGTLINYIDPTIFSRLRYPNLPDEPGQRIEAQLSFWAPLIREYLGQILRGEFTQWMELDNFESMSLTEFVGQISQRKENIGVNKLKNPDSQKE